MPIRQILKSASNATKFIFGEGGWALLPHEKRVLDAAIESLGPEARAAVRQQLEIPYFIERMNQGRINVFRFNRRVEPFRLIDRAYEDLLVRVRISIEDRTMTAHATVYRGIVFSVEFKRPTNYFKGKEVRVIGVDEGSPEESFTELIDRAEHGK